MPNGGPPPPKPTPPAPEPSPPSPIIGGVMAAVLAAVGTTAVALTPSVPGEPSPVIGRVLPTAVEYRPAVDFDRDGVANPRDPDDDNDGWTDVDDPRPLSLNNLDNDPQPNATDPDDDNDGILDTRDRYPLDQNNNGESDVAERRRLGARFDGDRDGRPDLAELRRVALAEAERLGITVAGTVRNLADIPREVFRNLPKGWNYVCQDRDNDGRPDATDTFHRTPGGSYANYTHDGRWEDHARANPDRARAYGLVGQGYTGTGELGRHEMPASWPPPGYVSGQTPSGTTETGGTGTAPSGGHHYDFYHNYYTHAPAPAPPPPTGAASPPSDGGGGGGTPPPPAPPGYQEAPHQEGSGTH